MSSAADHFRVEITGVPSVAEVQAVLRDLLERTRSSGNKRILLEPRVAKGLDLVATKLVVEEVPRLGFAPDVRFAIWVVDEQARRSAEFAEEVAENRGIAVRAFSGREAALQWLLG